MIQVKVIADSVGPSGARLTTFLLTYPRFIHSEFMTHRMLSRNAASSRAIPLKRTRAAVWNEPAMPIAFTKNQAGMQATETLAPWKEGVATWLWKWTGRAVSLVAWVFEKLGVHKQHANRILEPWLHITVVASGTDWTNFFALRCHPMAQPEFQQLARQMKIHYAFHTPRRLKEGEWHLPFVTDAEWDAYSKDQCSLEALLHKSVARCARTSYLNHDKTQTDTRQDTELHERLLGSAPVHASPAEHQARATRSKKYSGNFRGWVQYRKTLRGENVSES